MKLIGYYSSPYVRRVGITLKLYDLSFEHYPLSTSTDREAIKRYNPTGRLPALVLDSGEVLVDSSIIIDHLDELIGPENALTPPAGAPRRQVQSFVGFALAATDKYVAAYYETTKRPEAHVCQPWLTQLENQVDAALTVLNHRLDGPLLCGDRLTQAEVTAVAAIEAMRFDMPHLAPHGRYPKLDKLVAAVSAVDAFASTKPIT